MPERSYQGNSRPIHDIFFRSRSEKFTQKRVDDFERELSRIGSLKPKAQDKYEEDRALLRRATRRQVLAWGGAVGIPATVAVGLGVLFLADQDSVNKDTPSFAFEDWQFLRSKQFDSNSLREMGQTIEQDSQFPGFAEVGRIILEAATNPASLQKYTGMDVRSARAGLGRHPDSALAFINNTIEGEIINMEVINKNTGGKEVKRLVKTTSGWDYTVVLDDSAYAAPRIAKKLLIVKEFSHFLYWHQFKDALLQDVAQRWDFPNVPPENLKDFLFTNAVVRPENFESPLGGLYDDLNYLMDGAGYWHTTRAYGRMKDLGMISSRDVAVLDSGNRAFNQALARGILIKTGKGSYEWKEGISPLSPQWSSIIVPILKK